jgi:ribosomal protein L16/L10AE
MDVVYDKLQDDPKDGGGRISSGMKSSNSHSITARRVNHMDVVYEYEFTSHYPFLASSTLHVALKVLPIQAPAGRQ